MCSLDSTQLLSRMYSGSGSKSKLDEAAQGDPHEVSVKLSAQLNIVSADLTGAGGCTASSLV